MKNKLIFYTLFLMGFFVACEYENEEELFKEDGVCEEPVTFSSDIEPIINTNCAISGCHVAGGISPELTSYEKVKARAADIKHETHIRQMPPPSSGKSLTQEQIDHIACWVEQGVPIN